MEPVHDFAAKLRQPALAARRARVRRLAAGAARGGRARAAPRRPAPDAAPLSINLDLTTACNYACDHCIDWEILNSGVTHDEAVLRASIVEMARARAARA